MNYFRRTLPSLDALVFFEAAARHENYTRAAEELRVTQVAVSKRVRALEVDLGARLFVHRGRGLALTAEGRAFAERVRAGLAFLEEAIAVARGASKRRREVVQVAANENVNFFWLAPLVRAYQISGNDAVVSVVTANNVSDVVRAETDLAIFHATAPPAGWQAHELFEEIIVPITSPDYADRLAKGAVQPTLLDYRKESPDWMHWDNFSPAKAERWFPDATLRPCSSYIQSISLALDGKGIGFGVLSFLTLEIARGELVILGDRRALTGRKYYLATPEGKQPSGATMDLLAFLIDEGLRWRAPSPNAADPASLKAEKL